MQVADRGEISLDKLRSGDRAEWELAFPVLWQIAWRTVSKVCPHATDAEKEEMAAAGLNGKGKAVSQITNPTQEAFVRAKSFEDMMNLTAAVVRNTTIDTIRRNRTRDDDQNRERVENLFEQAPDPSAEADRADRKRQLAEAVARLEDNYRQVIEDFYFLDLKTEQIARKRGRPKGTVCVELQRARARLGELLRE